MWKPIKGYENLYEVSDMGEIRSLDRISPCGKGRCHLFKSKVLTPSSNGKGYTFVRLAKNGINKKHYIHRLVAEAFIDNGNNYPIINHKDENRANNKVDNLEWCTYKYNSNYGNIKNKIANKCSIEIIQIFPDGKEKAWKSAREVERQLGINHSNITACCKKKTKTAGGYKWRYAI